MDLIENYEVYYFKNADKIDTQQKVIMVSAGEDSTLRYWTFEQNKNTLVVDINDQMPSYSVDSQTTRPLCTVHAEDWSYVLVVDESEWRLFTFKAYRPTYVTKAPEQGQKLKGGLFIDNRHVLIYTESGDAYVYKLPRPRDLDLISHHVIDPPTALSRSESSIAYRIGRGNPFGLDESSATESDEEEEDDFELIKNEYQPIEETIQAGRGTKSSDTPTKPKPSSLLKVDDSKRSASSVTPPANSTLYTSSGTGQLTKSPSLAQLSNSILGVFGLKKREGEGTVYINRPDDKKKKRETIGHTVPTIQLPKMSNSTSDTDISSNAGGQMKNSRSDSNISGTSPRTPQKSNPNNPFLTVGNVSPITPKTPTMDDLREDGVMAVFYGANQSSTSIVSAIERAQSKSIMESGTSEPLLDDRSTDEVPVLIETLRESESIKASLGTSVWRSTGNVVIRADTNGALKLWRININSKSKRKKKSKKRREEEIKQELAEQTGNSSGEEEDQDKITIEEIHTATLASGWAEDSNKKRSKHPSKITASQFAIDKEKTPRLIHGHLDGTIMIYPSSVSMSDSEPIKIKAHEKKVTALLVIHDKSSEKRLLLVSGSADYSVKVWVLTTGVLLSEFNLHSGAVNLLFLPPKIIRKKLQGCFCSVAEDRSVVLYSTRTFEVIHVLGGHSSAVLAVYFKAEMDYLMVRCSDGTLYIWQLSTGLLERRVFGKVAASLIEQCVGIGSRRPIYHVQFMKSADIIEKPSSFLDTAYMAVDDRSPDIQMLMLSVRRLIGSINAKRDTIRQCIKEPDVKKRNAGLSHSMLCALGYVLQYGNNKCLTDLRTMLNIQAPEPVAYIGLKGAGTTFSLIVPKASDRSQPFIFSPVLSALHTVSCVSLLNALATIPELKRIASECIKYYLQIMPKEIERYEDPSFLWCAQFLRDSSKEIQVSARAIMSSVLTRMNMQQLRGLAEKLSGILLDSSEDSSTANTHRKQNIIVALAILAYRVPKAVDGRIASITAMGLIEILERGGAQHSSAISLLGDGYETWQYYIPDTMGFCRQLFQLSLSALNNSNQGDSDGMSSDALQAFVSMASVDTRLYIEFINGIVCS